MKRLAISAALAAAFSQPAAAALSAEDMAAINEMIAKVRADYEARIGALESRLKSAEDKAAAASERAEQAQQAAAAPPPAPPANPNAFNPEISLILSGIYSNHSRDPAGVRITGFHLPDDVLEGITPQRGFSLAESELGIYANIDPYFRGGLNFAIGPDGSAEAEEAFIQTLGLSHGLTVKAGRFFSGIGYLNEQHAHTWDFADAPLAYQAFLGGQMGDDGLQLRWLAPTDLFMELGAEVGRARSFPGSDRDKNGVGGSRAFAHIGGDIGDSQSWRAGVSYLSTSPRERMWSDTDLAATAVTNSFSGTSRLWVVDAVWKWAPHGNPYYTNFKLQGEYLRRIDDGTVTYDVDTASLGPTADGYSSTQSGWYLQGVYRFAPYWRIGLRADRLSHGRVDYAVNNANLARPDDDPDRYSLMVDYNPSEFSRIRLQFAQDKSRQGLTDNQVFVQYQMSLGTHGAHKF